MRLGKVVCVILISWLFSNCAIAQSVKPEKTANARNEVEPTSFTFSFRAMVTKVIDGCTVEVEIREGRIGEIEGQKMDLPSDIPEYNGSKIVRIVNTQCISMNDSIRTKAKETIARMAQGKFVEVLFRDWATIKNTEIIGELIVLENCQDVGFEQLKAGLARFRSHEKQTISEFDKRKYKEAEKKAKKQKVGVWRDGD